jgi:hypothetical protein
MDIEIYLWIFLVVFFIVLLVLRIFFGVDPTDSIYTYKDGECDTCGQISLSLSKGLCEYCSVFYKVHK